MTIATVKVNGGQKRKPRKFKPHQAFLRCLECDRWTTKLEAMARKFNTGACACGGTLRRVPPAASITQEKVIKARSL